jgi:hypothetical protein
MQKYLTLDIVHFPNSFFLNDLSHLVDIEKDIDKCNFEMNQLIKNGYIKFTVINNMILLAKPLNDNNIKYMYLYLPENKEEQSNNVRELNIFTKDLGYRIINQPDHRFFLFIKADIDEFDPSDLNKKRLENSKYYHDSYNYIHYKSDIIYSPID